MTSLIERGTDAAPCPVTLIRRSDDTHADRARRAGELVSVTRGIYAPARAWLALAPWERYLARVHAAGTRHPDAIFCLESAAALRGWPVFGEPAEVHVLAGDATTSRASGGVRSHTASTLPAPATIGRFLVTDDVATVVDIARGRHNAIGLAVACHALRVDPDLSTLALRAANESRLSSRGRRRARWVLDRATPDPETPFETVSLAAIEWLGFPAPELQVRVGGGRDRVDFWWRDRAVCGEADGDLKYDGRFGDPLEILRARRERDARLIARGARAVSHWSWSDLAHPERLRAALLSAGLRPVAAEDPVALRSLGRALSARLP